MAILLQPRGVAAGQSGGQIPCGQPWHSPPVMPGCEGPSDCKCKTAQEWGAFCGVWGKPASGCEPCCSSEAHFCGALVGNRPLPAGSAGRLVWEPLCNVAAPLSEGSELALGWECVAPLALSTLVPGTAPGLSSPFLHHRGRGGTLPPLAWTQSSVATWQDTSPSVLALPGWSGGRLCAWDLFS